MRIQYYKQFFSGPDAVGTQQPRELVSRLAERGHMVDVIAGDTNAYDERQEPPEERTYASGGRLTIHRFHSPRGMRENLRTRFNTYATFAVRAGVAGLALARPDVVMGSVQPLFTGIAALGVARASKAPFVLEIRDLWPDALETKGAVSGWKLTPLYAMASTLYRNASRIVSLTPGIKTELVSKGIDSAKIDVFPNGFDPRLFTVSEKEITATRTEHGWKDSFVALYTGTHTEVTSVETIVRAANDLRDFPGIRIDLFGQGQTKPGAIDLSERLGLSNVHFHDPVPKWRIPAIIAAADVCLMTLFSSPLINIYFENKFMDYLGSGKPILGAMDGMQAEILERHGAGMTVPAFDHAGLARLIERARHDPERLVKMGDAGRRLVHEHLLLERILEKYCEVVEGVADGRSGLIPTWEPRLLDQEP